MSPLAFAWRGMVRQPARSLLGVGGVMVVGALLFDMLMLSDGLVLSFARLLDEAGFDVRITSTAETPFTGTRIDGAASIRDEVLALDEVRHVLPMRLAPGELRAGGRELSSLQLMAVGTGAVAPWTLLDGEPLSAGRAVINRNVAEALDLKPGDEALLRGACRSDLVAPPPQPVSIAGIVGFPFDSAGQFTVGLALVELERYCGDADPDSVDMLLVRSADAGPDAAVAAIERLRPDLYVFSNRELLYRFQRTDFSYFRQISFVLTSMTLFFAFLLVAALLTVATNQRFGEIAALRALGFSRKRIVADLLWESTLLVGAGGLLAIPSGWLLGLWLDAILRGVPDLPAGLHFFVFQPKTLLLHGLLMAVTAILAAAYPVWLAARLPIASTLRRETVS